MFAGDESFNTEDSNHFGPVSLDLENAYGQSYNG